MKKDCVFCNLKGKEVIVYKDNKCIGLISKAPLNKHHVIIIPRNHYISSQQVPNTLFAHMFILAKKIATAITKACKADGITIIHDDGIFKTREHFTLHIIPRFKNDKIGGHYKRAKDPGLKLRSEYAKDIKKYVKNHPSEMGGMIPSASLSGGF